jgi:hypothetical protein
MLLKGSVLAGKLVGGGAEKCGKTPHRQFQKRSSYAAFKNRPVSQTGVKLSPEAVPIH